MNDELKHYGIVGMEWGKRRFQNEDGSLTAAGRLRYGAGESDDEDAEEKAKQKYIEQRINQYATLRKALNEYYKAKGKKKYKTGRMTALEKLNERYADVYAEAKKKLGVGDNAK